MVLSLLIIFQSFFIIFYPIDKRDDISNEDYSACAEKAKGSKGIDNFMRAIGEQESGDNYDAVKAKNRPQYANGIAYPSINEYADSVMSRFENVGKSSLRSEI